MKPGNLTRALLALVAAVTLLTALLFPAPVYAGASGNASPHEPPPPQTPANDLGSHAKKGSPSPPGEPAGDSTGEVLSSAGAPEMSGTPLWLASQLSLGALAPITSHGVLPNRVKFCPQSGPDFFNADCQEKSTIEEIITYIQSLDDASGVIYVDQDYSTGATLPQPGLVFDQNTFKNAGPSLVTGLDMHGGYDYSLGAATTTKTVLNQPVTIQNFNASSHFSMDMFQFNITGYAAGDPAAAAVNVYQSNHVTLTDLDIHESSTGSGIVAAQSNDLTLQRILLADSGGGRGVDISQTSTILLDQVNSTSTSTTGYGAYLSANRGTLTITNSRFDGSTNAGLSVLNHSGDITLESVDASNNGVFGVAFLSDSGGLILRNCQFNYNKNAGLETFAQLGAITLDTVTATNNRSNGVVVISHTGSLSTLNSLFNNNGASGLVLFNNSGAVTLAGVTADSNALLGASIGQSSGDVAILNSHFDSNGATGLMGNLQGGAITLHTVSASANTSNGANLLSFVSPGGSLPAIQVTGGDFSDNGGMGMKAIASGDIDISGASFMANMQSGLVLNGSSDISLAGVQAGSNGGYGAQLFFGGDVQISSGVFNRNRMGGLDMQYAFTPPPPGNGSPASFMITLNQVQALTNGGYGALVEASGNGSYPGVDIFIINSNFDRNRGKVDSGLTINTFGSVFMENVSTSRNTASGADITSLALFIMNSRFNSNGGYGLALSQSGNSALIDVEACFNHLGPVEQLFGTPLLQNLDTTCPAEARDTLAPVATVVSELPWQTIKVFSDVNQATGQLSCQMGTVFIYLQKGTPPAADQELARVELPPCIVPEGSPASFRGLDQSGLPASLPDGNAFLGPAFELAISAPGGGPANPGGALTLQFSLPGGFHLPVGKKLAALWFDPAAKEWVALATFAGLNSAAAFPVKTGVFVLVVK